MINWSERLYKLFKESPMFCDVLPRLVLYSWQKSLLLTFSQASQRTMLQCNIVFCFVCDLFDLTSVDDMAEVSGVLSVNYLAGPESEQHSLIAFQSVSNYNILNGDDFILWLPGPAEWRTHAYLRIHNMTVKEVPLKLSWHKGSYLGSSYWILRNSNITFLHF